MKRLGFIMGMAAFGAALNAVPAAADVKAGVDAWSQGNYSAAVAEWQGPAASGDADAQFNLAQAYRLGRGVDADIDRARGLYAQAAQQGHLKAADNYGLLLFQQGSRKQAMPYIQDAAGRGDPRAQYVLGLAHFNADHADKDWTRAYALLTLANSAGLPQASGAMAKMDQYIPFDQRQEAQILAKQIKQESDARRATQLASVALGSGPTNSSVPSGARVAQTLPSVPVAASNPAPRPPSTPVVVASLPDPAPAVITAPSPTITRPTTSRPAVRRPAIAAASSAAATGGPWKVQLGAFGVRSNADRMWNKLSGTSALSGAKKVLVPSGRITRLQAGGFASRAQANKACARLKASGNSCLVTR
ncbi:MAG: SPOR domain-containing protein [Erythrobacter sp.]